MIFQKHILRSDLSTEEIKKRLLSVMLPFNVVSHKRNVHKVLEGQITGNKVVMIHRYTKEDEMHPVIKGVLEQVNGKTIIRLRFAPETPDKIWLYSSMILLPLIMLVTAVIGSDSMIFTLGGVLNIIITLLIKTRSLNQASERDLLFLMSLLDAEEIEEENDNQSEQNKPDGPWTLKDV